MFEKATKYIYSKIDTLTSITLHIGKEDVYAQICTLSQKKGIVSLNNQKENIPYQSILKHIDKEIPIVLSILGKGIIHRKLDNQDNFTLTDIIPNANKEDFYIQRFTGNDPEYISLIRKEKLNELIKPFGKNGYYIQHIGLGPFPLSLVWKMFNELPHSLELPEHQVRFDTDKNITNIAAINESNTSSYVQLGEDSIKNSIIVPYAHGVGLFADQLSSFQHIGNPYPINPKEFFYRKLYKKVLWTGLAFLLLVLLINFLIFSSFQDKIKDSMTELNANQDQLEKIEQLETSLREKEELSKKLVVRKNSTSAYYADQLASLLPQGIILASLTYQPIEKKISSDEPILIYQHVIRITGYTKNGSLLDSWIKEINNEQWVMKTRIENYQHHLQENYGEFSLLILLQDE